MTVIFRSILAFVFAALIGVHSVRAVETTSTERQDADRWVAATFEGRLVPPPDNGYILPELRSGSLEKNARMGRQLRIADASYTTGVYCPSAGAVKVHLPGPGARFIAWTGVDSNDVTYYSGEGRGHVVIEVLVGGVEKFRSPVMNEGKQPVRVDVALDGATDFTLQVVGGEDSNWDQVDFADAEIILADQSKLALSDLPIAPLPGEYNVAPPFSFVYAGISSSDLLKHWPVERHKEQLDPERTRYTLTYQDPKTGLQVRCVGIEYHDFAVVEWATYLRNMGSSDTPILESIQGLDTQFERTSDGEFLLRHNKGAPATPSDYEPYETLLGKSAKQHLEARGGRSSNGDFPYFNLSWTGGGVIIVVGWPGQWSGEFDRDDANGVHVHFGQELTHFKLLPGEEVRTPRMVLQFWRGDWLRSQNLWRHWMEAHNMPHPGGELPPPQVAGNTSHEYVEMMEATDRDENYFIDRYRQEHIKIDYFWMDAGWYQNNGSWENTGTWEVDRKRFPGGLRAVSDHAHANGVKIIVWFEPERVTPGSWLYEHHPEWLLSAPPNHGDQLYDSSWRLFNFGDPKAREWMTDHVDKMITEQGIDLYRQDFNMDPLNFWRAHDAVDRQGITENKYVTGYLEYWDELRRRHPNMLIDSCASGGRRNDIDTLLRAVPLTRSDYLLEPTEPISQQMQTYGMAQWIPFFGTGINGMDRYVFRSQMTPAIVTGWDLRRKDLNYDLLRTLVQQWRSISADYYGDYYPLTSYSLANDVWAAMQFNRDKAGQGFIEVFRRSRSPYERARFRLHCLDPDADYTVTNIDVPSTRNYSGRMLMDVGIDVQLQQAPDSALLIYKRAIPDLAKDKEQR